HEAGYGTYLVGGPSEEQVRPQCVSRSAIYCIFCNVWRRVQLMAANDICADIAALLTPIPERPDQDTARDGNVDDDAYDDMAQEAWQERESLAETLRLSWQEGDADPLLSTLADLRQRRLR